MTDLDLTQLATSSDAMGDDGALLLNDVEAFLARFVAYPSSAALVAHVLWIAHTWFMDQWESTPRIAFLSPEPGSGKSRALEVTEPLVPRPVHAVNVTPAYLFRKVSDDAGPPTILHDEIDTVFGQNAKDNEDIRGMLNAGHRRGAMAGRCVNRGNNVVTEELPAYCAVALAGLNDLPDTIMSRSVIIRMRRRTAHEYVEPWRRRINAPEAITIADRLNRWSIKRGRAMTWPEMPPTVTDRNADVWEPLLAVADLAGGTWPERARDAAVLMVDQSGAAPPSLNILLLGDLRAVFADHDRLATATILERLHQREESPWSDLNHKPLDAVRLARRLSSYGVSPKPLRFGTDVVRGYEAADLADPWSRYLPPAEPVTPVTPATRLAEDAEYVAAVTDVTPLWGEGDEP